MRQAVAALFCFEDKIFTVVRNPKLGTFPGYIAFPGGKVDKGDIEEGSLAIASHEGMSKTLWNALSREMAEELEYDLENNRDNIEAFYPLGIAITPEFNPYRFETHYFVVRLKSEPTFVVDRGEAVSFSWQTPKELFESYKRGQLLVVPPMLMLIQALAHDFHHQELLDLSLKYDPETEVPMIEPVAGVKQFLPLSHTFPPANRTNCFLIGDQGREVLIDPSPCSEDELKKLKKSLSSYNVSKIFITHHHPDHHEYAPRLAREWDIPIGMSAITFEYLNEKWGADYLKDLTIEIYREDDVLTQSLGLDVTIYEVPGHDAGQLALAPTSMNWFLVSDLIQTVGTVVIGGKEGDMSAYFASLEKVIALRPAVCLPSHGIAVGGVYKLEKTLAHRKRRETDIIALLKKNYTVTQIVETLYHGLNEKLIPYALKTVEAHLKKIEAEKESLLPKE